jgi:hypothetical protein
MLRFLILTLFVAACSTVKSGGDGGYRYDPEFQYSHQGLRDLAPEVVKTMKRDPHVKKLDDLFSKKLPDLKRVGVLIFETKLQSTRSGLAGEDKIYLSASGKQLLTESLLNVWEETLPLMSPEFMWVRSDEIRTTKSFSEYGLPVEDYVKSDRSRLDPDDLFFLPKGKETTPHTVLNPRHMRDMALLLVPAYELVGGPKWSEHHKLFINDVAKELNLDAVIVIMSDVSWSTQQISKQSGERTPEEMTFRLEASVLVPFSKVHERLKKLGSKEEPMQTICFRAYETKLNIPLDLSKINETSSFGEIEETVVNPMLKTYRDLVIMNVDQISADLRKTF